MADPVKEFERQLKQLSQQDLSVYQTIITAFNRTVAVVGITVIFSALLANSMFFYVIAALVTVFLAKLSGHLDVILGIVRTLHNKKIN